MLEFIIYIIVFCLGVEAGFVIEKSNYKPIGSEDVTQKEINEKELVVTKDNNDDKIETNETK